MRGPGCGKYLILADIDGIRGNKADVRESRYHFVSFIFDLVVVLAGSKKHPGASKGSDYAHFCR